MSKLIIVRWVEENDNLNPLYDSAMRVIESDHKMFVKGAWFGFGFFNIATEEGYTILSLPRKKEENF